MSAVLSEAEENVCLPTTEELSEQFLKVASNRLETIDEKPTAFFIDAFDERREVLLGRREIADLMRKCGRSALQVGQFVDRFRIDGAEPSDLLAQIVNLGNRSMPWDQILR